MYEYDSRDIAEILCKLAKTMDNQDIENCEEAIYYLRTVARNPLNADYFRTMWRVLQAIADYSNEWLYGED